MENHGYYNGLLKARPCSIHLALASAIFLSALLSNSGCNFDRERQLSLILPATLEVRNESGHSIELVWIYSTVDTDDAFGIKGGTLSNGASMDFKIPESSFNTIKAGKFGLSGQCGDLKDWQKPGSELLREAVRDEHDWRVTVTIDSC